MHAEETDLWKEINPKTFKRPDFGYKRSYNINTKSHNSSESSNFCWLHKSKAHSAFHCSYLARKNDICTFCGLKRYKDCHKEITLNCKMENCQLKHHMLFCYKRYGKNDRNFIDYNERNDDSDQNSTQSYNSQTSHQEDDKNNNSHHIDAKNNTTHRTDNKNNCNHINDSDNDEIVIPPSNFYINQPPRSIKVKRNGTNHNRNSHTSMLN